MGLSAREMMGAMGGWGREWNSWDCWDIDYSTDCAGKWKCIHTPPSLPARSVRGDIFEILLSGTKTKTKTKTATYQTRPDQLPYQTTTIPTYNNIKYQLPTTTNLHFSPARSPLSTKRTFGHFLTHRLLTIFGHIHHHHISRLIPNAPTRLHPPTHTAHPKKPRTHQPPLTAPTPLAIIVCSRLAPANKRQPTPHLRQDTVNRSDACDHLHHQRGL